MGAQVMVGDPLYYPALPPGGRYRTDVSGFRARRFMGSIRLLDGWALPPGIWRARGCRGSDSAPKWIDGHLNLLRCKAQQLYSPVRSIFLGRLGSLSQLAYVNESPHNCLSAQGLFIFRAFLIVARKSAAPRS